MINSNLLSKLRGVQLRYLGHFSFLFICLLCYFSYLPAFSSPFILDDFPNLEALSQIQDESIFSSGFWEFVFSGQAGPTGRPLALFTLALQAESWPNNPAAFKLINFCIHLSSSALIYVFCQLIFRALKTNSKNAIYLSLFITSIWALHPTHSTSVVYTIQRMALLSNFFIVLGAVSHLYLRVKTNNSPWKLVILLSVSISISGLLALFSKENAPSLLLYILALEYTVLSSINTSTLFKKWRLVFLWLPVSFLTVLSIASLSVLQERFQSNFTYNMSERVLTESRILWQYLHAIITPSTSNAALFKTVQISTSLISPVSTLISSFLWVLLFILALQYRKRAPLFSLAILWFFAGHAIESSFLPLELFFHHRNYLASLGLIIALVYYPHYFFSQKSASLSPRNLTFGKYLISTLIISFLWFQSHNTAKLWEKPLNLASFWYLNDPGTSRNSEFYAIQLINLNEDGIIRAAHIYEQIISDNPTNFRLVLNRLTLNCLSSKVPRLSVDFINQHIQQRSTTEKDTLAPFLQILNLSNSGNCPNLNPEQLEDILDNIYPSLPSVEQGTLDFEKANLRVAESRIAEAMVLFESSYLKNNDPGVLFTHAIHLISQQEYRNALGKIELARKEIKRHNNINTGTRKNKLRRLIELEEEVLQQLKRDELE